MEIEISTCNSPYSGNTYFNGYLADLKNFADHSNYATLTKNAHYDFRNESLEDISGNGNDAVVTGTERYGVVK